MWLSAAWLSANSLHAEDDTPAVRGVERVNISTGGIGIYRPGLWGAVRVSLRNPQDREVRLLATTHFQDDPTLQYGRRLWMPPHSRTVVWHPIRMPSVANPNARGKSGEVSTDEKFFEIRSQVMSIQNGQETLAINESGALHVDQSIRISSDTQTAAMIGVPGMMDHDRGAEFANAVDLIFTARYERSMNRNLTALSDEQLPAAEEMLGTLDQMFIYDDRISQDLAAISAIRRWVVGGGRLWIMADMVGPQLLDALLGDQDSLQVVGRTELTSVVVTASPMYQGVGHFERNLDKPVTMVRVIGDGFTPAFMCDGWPAALWKNYGAGKILVTTLGADGWLRPRLDRDPVPEGGPHFITGFYPGDPLNSLSVDFCTRHSAKVLPAEIAEETVQGLIGYRIPGRNLVLGCLLIFTLLIAAGSYWLSRRGRMEYMGLAIPTFSLLMAGLLLGAGMKTRNEIPNATAAVQLVQSVPGTDDVRMTGAVGYFVKGDSDNVVLQGNSGGYGIPEMQGLTGSNRRLIWTDLDKWSWEKITLNPGLRIMDFQSGAQLEHPLRATAGFAEGQLTGQLQLPSGVTASDAILATSSGRIGLAIQPDGKWSIAQETLGAEQYVAGTVLSDQQQQRSRILSKILEPISGQMNPPAPTVYAWTKPWDSAIAIGQQSPAGSAVVAAPVEWQPLLPGTEITIPRALMHFREVTGPDGIRPSGFYDTRARQWMERTGSNEGWVAFDLPTELLPLTTSKVEITLKVTGPVGRLELSGYRDGSRKSLKVWENPVGTLQHTVEDGQLMPIEANGRIAFHIAAGLDDAPVASRPESKGKKSKATDEQLTTYWQFEDISMRVTAKIPAPGFAVNPQ